jgi:hypothetical protein
VAQRRHRKAEAARELRLAQPQALSQRDQPYLIRGFFGKSIQWIRKPLQWIE